MVQNITIINTARNEQIDLKKDGTSQFILDSIDWDSPSVNVVTSRVPYQIGTTLSGMDFGSRSPIIEGYIIADTKNNEYLGKTWQDYFDSQLKDIEEKKKTINRIINPLQDIMILVGDYYLEGRPTSPVVYSIKESENNEVICKFTLNVSCFSPMFKLSKKKQVEFTQSEPKFKFPLVLKKTGNLFGVMQQQTLVNVINDGDCASGGVIKIEAVGGNVENPEVFNVDTQESFSVNTTITAGDYIIINTNIGEESVIHHYVSYFGTGETRDESDIGNVLEGSVFLQFKQGNNLYGYSADGGQTFVSISVEIEEQYFNFAEM